MIVNVSRNFECVYRLFGPHTETEWAIEGRRLVPLLPREPPKTVYSIIADQAANLIAFENSRLGDPAETANKGSGRVKR